MVAEIFRPNTTQLIEFLVGNPQWDQEHQALLNEYGDRKFVFKKEDSRFPYLKRTAYHGMTLYGEWVELMEIIEERRPTQDPLYTIGLFVVSGPKNPHETLLTQYTYANPKSGWEEGYRVSISGNPATAASDFREMQAHAITKDDLPYGVDVEATVHAFYQNIRNHTMTTPPLFRTDHQTER